MSGLVAVSGSSAFGAAKATVVGTDPAGDWGTNGPQGDDSLNAMGDALGINENPELPGPRRHIAIENRNNPKYVEGSTYQTYPYNRNEDH